MFALISFLTLSELPPLSDLQFLPSHSTAICQLALYQQHREVLRELHSVRGWSGGVYERWLCQIERDIQYWWLVGQIHSSPFGFASEWNRGRLLLLQNLIGKQSYYSGWHPEILPEPSKRYDEVKEIPAAERH